MFVNFDTNAFDPGDAYYTAGEEGAYIQNIYDFLADCYKYSVTKTINPGEMCVGDTAVYQICYENLGDQVISNVSLWDSIPTCFTITGTSTAPDGQSGNLLWWDIATVPIGANVCIDITVRADFVPPCP